MWQRIALNTWRDTKDQEVPRFIYTFIEAVAESRNPHFIHKIDIARHVLPLTKPFPEQRWNRDYLSASSYSIFKDLSHELEIISIISNSTDTPSMTKIKILSVLGGLKFTFLHASLISAGRKPLFYRHVFEMFISLAREEFTRDPKYRQAATYLENMTASEKIYHYTFFKNIEIFAPITGNYIQEALHSEKSGIASVIKSLMRNKSIRSVTFTNVVDEFVMVPSDIGVPIIGEIYRPIFAYQNIRSNVTKDVQWKKTKLQGRSITKAVFGNEVALSMLVPWTNQTIAVEVHGEHSVHLPQQFSAELDTTKADVKVLDYSMQILNEQQKPVSNEIIFFL